MALNNVTGLSKHIISTININSSLWVGLLHWLWGSKDWFRKVLSTWECGQLSILLRRVGEIVVVWTVRFFVYWLLFFLNLLNFVSFLRLVEEFLSEAVGFSKDINAKVVFLECFYSNFIYHQGVFMFIFFYSFIIIKVSKAIHVKQGGLVVFNILVAHLVL